MKTTNIKLAIRSIRKNKVHSGISILGLGIGLGCIMLLALLYIHDTSFDRFIPQHKNVYRITRGNSCQTAYPLAEMLNDENPLVDKTFRYYQKAEIEIKKGSNEIVADERCAFADASMFDVLGIEFKVGVPCASRTEIVISEKMARKYFAKQNAIGKELLVRLNEDFIPLTVCGVYTNFPSNSTLAPEFVADVELSGEALGFSQKMFGDFNKGYDAFKNWDRSLFYTYVRLLPDAKPAELPQFLEKYKMLTSNEKRREMDFGLQAVKDIYLKSDNLGGSFYSRLGNAKDLKYYLGIALLILLIAVINYIFLTRAKIESRLKEIGSQKALGASQSVLGKQIVMESNIVALLSLIPALGVITLGIPFVNKTMNQTINLDEILMWKTGLVFIATVLLTGTLSGIFIASGTIQIPSVLLLKGKKSATPKTTVWNSAILSVHFTIFIVLISSVFTLQKQLHFALTNFKGINPENVLVFELNSDELSKQYQYIENEVDKIPGVLVSAGSSFIPPFNNFLPLSLADKNGEKIRFDGLIMGKGMIELLEIDVIDGETFGDYNPENRSIIFNESAAKQYNLKAGELFSGLRVGAIVKDFNAHSLRDLIQPMAIIQQHPEKMRLFVIKTNGLNNASILTSVTEIFKTISPDKIVNSYMLTDQINQFYTQEQNQAQLISAFSLLAILLSVMGLLGMTLISITRKTKEIGVRKVNGAKISEVMVMLNIDLVKWVVVAIVIATPLAFYVMNKWLESFAYKTTLSWWIFALSGLLALGITLLTVSWQSWRAATRNPVEALRYE
ncbi:ABC transporter permease [Prolixibacteraceae bacterium Z1-6]|uniref:ABC transporter permease n=1 Tax=Draconibacterium aestuarii TaxID=2998507 RepID=A0A9X3F2B8_9BACT|nr:ABC transporter permease [Prolixibacteraceae bacterium Z1-6]